MKNSFRRSHYIDSNKQCGQRLGDYHIERKFSPRQNCNCYCHRDYKHQAGHNYGYNWNMMNNRNNNYGVYGNYVHDRSFWPQRKDSPIRIIENNRNQISNTNNYRDSLYFQYGEGDPRLEEQEQAMIANTKNRYDVLNKADDYKNKLNFQYGNHAEAEMKMIAGTKNRCDVLNKANDYKNKLHFRYGDYAKEEMKMIAGTKNHRYQLNSANDYKNKLNFQYGEGAPSLEKQWQAMTANTKNRCNVLNKADDYKNKLNFQYGYVGTSFKEPLEAMTAKMREKNDLVDKTRRILYGNIDTTQRSTPQVLNNAHTAGGDKCNSYPYKQREDTYNQNMTELKTQVANIIKINQARIDNMIKRNQDRIEKNKEGYKVRITVKRKAKDKQELLQENEFNHQFLNRNACQNGKGDSFSYNDWAHDSTEKNKTLKITQYNEKYHPKTENTEVTSYDNKKKEIVEKATETNNLDIGKNGMANAKN